MWQHQVVAVVSEPELGLPVADLTHRVGISEQTFSRQKKQYAGLKTDNVRELMQPTEENARPKRLVAELCLQKAVLHDVLSKKLPAGAQEGCCGLYARLSWLTREGFPRGR